VPVLNHPGILQRHRRRGDAIPWDTQPVSDGFMGEEEGLGLAAILGHEQASRQAGQDGVESMAYRRLRELIEEGVGRPK
jgi:hypothetical protein